MAFIPEIDNRVFASGVFASNINVTTLANDPSTIQQILATSPSVAPVGIASNAPDNYGIQVNRARFVMSPNGGTIYLDNDYQTNIPLVMAAGVGYNLDIKRIYKTGSTVTDLFLGV